MADKNDPYAAPNGLGHLGGFVFLVGIALWAPPVDWLDLPGNVLQWLGIAAMALAIVWMFVAQLRRRDWPAVAFDAVLWPTLTGGFLLVESGGWLLVFLVTALAGAKAAAVAVQRGQAHAAGVRRPRIENSVLRSITAPDAVRRVEVATKERMKVDRRTL